MANQIAIGGGGSEQGMDERQECMSGSDVGC